MLLVSANVLGDEALRLHGNAIQAAKDAGVKRILYTSHQAASPTSKVIFARDHAATEGLLKASGVPFVSLRNGFYAESSLYQLGGMKETGKLALPEDGPVSWTVRDDLAEAAVAALTDLSVFDGITAPLTAARTYTFTDVARIASDVLDSRDCARDDLRKRLTGKVRWTEAFRNRWWGCWSPCSKPSAMENSTLSIRLLKG